MNDDRRAQDEQEEPDLDPETVADLEVEDESAEGVAGGGTVTRITVPNCCLHQN